MGAPEGTAGGLVGGVGGLAQLAKATSKPTARIHPRSIGLLEAIPKISF
jgi:hypothetical protein